jgi:carboxymethylenebutenolidase
MGIPISLTAGDGHVFDAYLSEAPNAVGGLVVLQEIFGVNHHIRNVVDRFAAEGFTALAPALFDRTEKGVELRYDDAGIQEGKKLAYGLPPEKILLDIEAAIAAVKSRVTSGKVGVVGYCFGGSYAWLSATRLRPDAAVGYYGSMAARFAGETPHCPVMMHFGLEDKGIPQEDVEKIRTAHPEIPVYLYEAGHGFSCDEREGYVPAAAALARERTLELFRTHLK